MTIQQKSIYIIYTGGTIGMQRSQQGYVPSQGYLQQQLQQIPWLQRLEMPKFTIHEYQPLIDSSEMTPAIWQQIATDIQTHYSDYDGFIVIQGTDTMAFTASALSFMLQHLAKPVIVTGSQIPLSELRSDGQSNLVNALYLVAHYPINEVTLFFDQKLFRGNRVTKVHADGFSAFTSPNFPPLLETGIHIRQLNLSQSLIPSKAFQIQKIHPQPIAIITLYPGLEMNLLHSLLSQSIKAVILRTYGVGNAPRNPSFLLALKQIIAQEIPVVNLTQCLSGRVNMQGYATGQSLASLGIISGADMTLEATVAKLHYLLSQPLTLSQLSQAISANLRGELTLDGENSDWEAVGQLRQLGGIGG